MILLVDNYDSFTYNLVQRLGEIDPGVQLRVVRNDQVTLDEIEAAAPVSSDHLARPMYARAGGNLERGHQAVRRLAFRSWGFVWDISASAMRWAPGSCGPAGSCTARRRSIHHDGRGVYRGLSNPFEATRYHSLLIEPGTLPDDLEVVAWTDQDEIMGVRHKRYPLEGVQFHPESFLTEEGIKLLKNFLDKVEVNRH